MSDLPRFRFYSGFFEECANLHLPEDVVKALTEFLEDLRSSPYERKNALQESGFSAEVFYPGYQVYYKLHHGKIDPRPISHPRLDAIDVLKIEGTED